MRQEEDVAGKIDDTKEKVVDAVAEKTKSSFFIIVPELFSKLDAEPGLV